MSNEITYRLSLTGGLMARPDLVVLTASDKTLSHEPPSANAEGGVSS